MQLEIKNLHVSYGRIRALIPLISPSIRERLSVSSVPTALEKVQLCVLFHG